MVLSIDIAPQTEVRLRQQAQAAGKGVQDYVSQLIAHAAAKPSLEEILADSRKKFDATGVSEDELIRDITEAQSEYRAEFELDGAFPI